MPRFSFPISRMICLHSLRSLVRSEGFVTLFSDFATLRSAASFPFADWVVAHAVMYSSSVLYPSGSSNFALRAFFVSALPVVPSGMTVAAFAAALAARSALRLASNSASTFAAAVLSATSLADSSGVAVATAVASCEAVAVFFLVVASS